MKLGVAYYPEYTPNERWYKDLCNIKNIGIDTIRFGEFAWARLQPNEFEYDFEWMDEALEMAKQCGLKVILTTPTACPPIWLVEKYSDVMPVNREGKVAGFGGRQHRCYNSPNYLKFSKQITEQLANRYGKNPVVIGWQIDNELGGEQKTCYCDNCRKKFQERLQKKYTTIANLNDAWMTDFWSQKYITWNQIPVPSKLNCDMELGHNPGLRLEFAQHCSDSIVEFTKMQYDILRAQCPEHVFITTNQDTFPFGDNVNVYDMYQVLDVPAFDIYTSDMAEFAFYCDVFRSCSKSPDKDFMLLEFGAQTPELSKYADYAEALNCKAFSLFTYKGFRNGQERGFQAIYDAQDNPSSALAELEKIGTSKKKLERNKKVYIYYDFRSSWSMEIANPSWHNERHIYHKYLLNNVYRYLHQKSYDVEFLFTPEQINAIGSGQNSMLVLANQFIASSDLEAALKVYMTSGGKIITTSNIFTIDDSNALREETTSLKEHANMLVMPDDADATQWAHAIKKFKLKKKKQKKKTKYLKTKIFSAILVVLILLYTGFVYAQFQPFQSLRELFISSCLSTHSLKILPEYLFPDSELERIKNIMYPVVSEVSDNTKVEEKIELPEFAGIGEPPSPDRKLAIIELDEKQSWEVEKVKKIKHSSTSMYITENITNHSATVTTSKRYKYTYKPKRYLVQKGMDQFIVDVVQVSNQLFKGNMLVISDPSKVVVAKARRLGVVGDSLAQLIKNVKGIGGINAGGYVDAGWVGNGGKPVGLLMSEGKQYNPYSANGRVVVGFTKKNKLVVGNIGAAGVKKRKIRDAIQFRTPVIINGKTIYNYSDNSATGIHPRTAIGQKKTGEVILLTIDGRQAGSPGATLYDVQTILHENGCINACNLDGGHSSFMIWNKKMISNPYQNNPDKTLPDAFVIKP